VNDLFSLIYSIISAFFKLASDLSPFVIWKGLPDAKNEFDGLYNFLKFLDDSVQSYVESIAAQCFSRKKEEINFLEEMEPELEEKSNNRVDKLKETLKKKIKSVANGPSKVAILELPQVDEKSLCVRLNSIHQVWHNVLNLRESIFKETEKVVGLSKSEFSALVKKFQYEPSATECWKLFDQTELRIQEFYPKISDVLAERIVKTKISVLHRKLYLPSISGYYLRKSSFQYDIRTAVAFCVDYLGNALT
jgi:hypothetical protein